MPSISISRRRFLGAGAASAGLGLALRPLSALAASDALGGRASDWQELLRLLEGEVYLPADPGYGLRARVNNLRYMDWLPRAIAVIPDARRASAAIQWCATQAMPFRIKGGGHSYAGYSAGPELILYSQGMNRVAAEGDTVTVGAGAINYMVYDGLEAVGRTVTHGRCPTVGVSGFVLGGGIGFDMRRFGVASDSLIAAELVTADGRIRQLSERNEPELFWALRGGAGGNFGLSTAFTFRTQDVVGQSISVFQRRYATPDPEVMAAFLANLLARCQNMPRDLGTRMSVQYVKPPGAVRAQFSVDFLGQWAGPPGELAALFAELDAALRPQVVIDFRGPYWDGQHLLEEPEELYFYQERSCFIPTVPDRDALVKAMHMLAARPPVHGPCDLRFFQTGGAVNDVAPDATAFVHRSSQWLALVGYYWESRDNAHPALIAEGHAWQNAFYDSMRTSFNGVGAFQNFPDPSLKDWAEAYYGQNLARLRAVKKAVDPNRLFDFPQAI